MFRKIKVDVKVLLRHNFCCKTELNVLTIHCRHGFTYLMGCIQFLTISISFFLCVFLSQNNLKCVSFAKKNHWFFSDENQLGQSLPNFRTGQESSFVPKRLFYWANSLCGFLPIYGIMQKRIKFYFVNTNSPLYGNNISTFEVDTSSLNIGEYVCTVKLVTFPKIQKRTFKVCTYSPLLGESVSSSKLDTYLPYRGE